MYTFYLQLYKHRYFRHLKKKKKKNKGKLFNYFKKIYKKKNKIILFKNFI